REPEWRCDSAGASPGSKRCTPGDRGGQSAQANRRSLCSLHDVHWRRAGNGDDPGDGLAKFGALGPLVISEFAKASGSIVNRPISTRRATAVSLPPIRE